MKYGLRDDIVAKIIQVFVSFPAVKTVIIYGSRANGNFKPSSDIDLTVKGDSISLEMLNRIHNQLDDLLLPYTFDLSVFDHITQQDLLDHIERVGVVLYEK